MRPTRPNVRKKQNHAAADSDTLYSNGRLSSSNGRLSSETSIFKWRSIAPLKAVGASGRKRIPRHRCNAGRIHRVQGLTSSGAVGLNPCFDVLRHFKQPTDASCVSESFSRCDKTTDCEDVKWYVVRNLQNLVKFVAILAVGTSRRENADLPSQVNSSNVWPELFEHGRLFTW